MPKTKEQVKAYNKEYFARPEVKARAKIRNAQYRKRRAEYKKTEAGRAAEKRYRQSDASKERLKRNRLKTLYNLTPEQLQTMFKNQGGLCGICNTPITSYHIDHDHETNEVRGLLCAPCNMALGLFKDSSEVLESAKQYLNGIY